MHARCQPVQATHRFLLLPWQLSSKFLLCCPADFTNLVSQMHLQDLAEADAVKEQVQQVQVRPASADVLGRQTGSSWRCTMGLN